MGQSVCGGHDRGIDLVLNVIQPQQAQAEGHPFGDWKGSTSAGSYSCSSAEFGAPGALEVAQEIAADRQFRRYECSSVIPSLFDVKDPGMQDPPSVRVAINHTTGMVRRLVTVQKPSATECQERLRSTVRQFQELRSDGIARILEVFEDSRAMSLVMEHCSGGTVYDRILQRQYFAEQESAVLVSHLLQSVSFLHQHGLYHGLLTPDAWRFQSDQAHASLKLVDFGLDLKVHMWDELSGLSPATGSRDRGRRTAVLQLFETCRIVFGAPEVVKPSCGAGRGKGLAQADRRPGANGTLNVDLLAQAIDAHLEQEEGLGAHDALAAADAWSVGAIAFLLLCGYPPFFAPYHNAILARIEKTDFSFDPPFWSKISEEAKDFVQQCLRATPGRRMTVSEALRHPWIQNLADNSPSGSMLASFALNLRRFYRTSLIEVFTANSLASKLSHGDACELLSCCSNVDTGQSGFVTATDLRQILMNLGHSEIAEAIGMCFSRTLRHPGESYIDYVALVESTRLRRERLMEEELWHHFREFDRRYAACDESGRMPTKLVPEFLQVPAVRQLAEREGMQASASCAAAAQPAPLGADPLAMPKVDFIEIATELLQQLPALPAVGVGPR